MPKLALKSDNVVSLILSMRGERVLLSEQLAQLYGVTVGALNQAIKRNIERFPADFMFQLTREEADPIASSRSQSVILKRGYNIKYLPYAFTEQGVANALQRTALTARRRSQHRHHAHLCAVATAHGLEPRLGPQD